MSHMNYKGGPLDLDPTLQKLHELHELHELQDLFFFKNLKLQKLHELQGGALALDNKFEELHELHELHFFLNLSKTTQIT